ncbi:Sugar phosphate permease [Alkalithermobacter thermoalcaliphilus JW-YL-7 = DSM 7308]|uniref:Major facilitator superfamily MFS_1 n=1 Tax=Alkalithermobacter thermoalcaliphilus JW-YL-7 = DSM 7308 TaxID=1121328 RepID=A0A150FT39_CLOPD|nr:major facilitator superfamily MFS_1 [[Clostridium] paradoxum JW-YL-7 = DSM 7308]SHL28140.1 Sugar phosphate permease [[Clostridium] paradoxum JW-YL-7 = DSM 7308]
MKKKYDQDMKKLLTYRWFVWGVLAIAYIIVFFHRLAVGVVKDDLQQAFNISSTTIGNLASMYFYAYMIMQVPSGILADSIGARKTVTIGTLLAGVGSILFGFAPNIQIAFIGRLLVGIGVSVIFIPMLKIQTEWFYTKEFATMTGITSFVGNLGGIIAQSPLVLLSAAIGWRNSFILIGIVSIGLAIVCHLVIRNTPQDMNLPSIAQIEGRKIDNEKINIPQSLKKVLKNKYTWPGFIVFAGMFGPFVSLTGAWGQSYLINVYNMESVKAANYITLAVLGLAVGSIFIGKISDKVGKRKLPMIVAVTINVISWGLLVFINNGKIHEIALYPLMLLIGLSTSAFTLTWSCVKEINDPKIAGISTSVVNTGGFLGAAILPPVIGNILDKYSSVMDIQLLYQRAFIYAFISVIISLIASLFIKETNCKNI